MRCPKCRHDWWIIPPRCVYCGVWLAGTPEYVANRMRASDQTPPQADSSVLSGASNEYSTLAGIVGFLLAFFLPMVFLVFAKLVQLDSPGRPDLILRLSTILIASFAPFCWAVVWSFAGGSSRLPIYGAILGFADLIIHLVGYVWFGWNLIGVTASLQAISVILLILSVIFTWIGSKHREAAYSR